MIKLCDSGFSQNVLFWQLGYDKLTGCGSIKVKALLDKLLMIGRFREYNWTRWSPIFTRDFISIFKQTNKNTGGKRKRKKRRKMIVEYSSYCFQ